MPAGTPSPVRRSPLYHWHLARGARFVEMDGWQLPLSYTDPRQETEATRNGLGLADVSPFAKLCLRGPGVAAVAVALGNLGPRSVLKIEAGLACRLTEDCLFLLAGSTRLAGFVEPSSSAQIVRTDITSAYAGFALVGKHVEALVGRLTSFDVGSPAFPEGSCAETELAGVHALLVRPAGRFTPEIGVYVAWDLGEYVWEVLWGAGRDFSIVPVGLEAMTSNQSRKP
jgi:glycine cleavage system aminomethyltransferase T